MILYRQRPYISNNTLQGTWLAEECKRNLKISMIRLARKSKRDGEEIGNQEKEIFRPNGQSVLA